MSSEISVPSASTLTTRTFAPELVRAFAIVLVIVIHIACFFLIDHSSKYNWDLANLINAFARPCVPLFFMLTGFLLLGSKRDESPLEFYKKRFRRIIVPFFFWAFIYFGWRHFHHHESMHISKMLRELVAGPIFYHFGFMFSLISLYLVTPYLKIMARHSSLQSLLWLSILWLVSQGVSVFVAYFWKFNLISPNELVTHYLGYFVLGFYLASLKPTKVQYCIVLLLCLLAYAATVFGTSLINVDAAHGTNELFYDYVSPNVIVQSGSLFVLLLGLGRKYEAAVGLFPRFIRFVGSSSLGIYLMQSLVIEMIYLPRGTLPLPIYISEAVVIVLCICAAVCFCISKTPVLREII